MNASYFLGHFRILQINQPKTVTTQTTNPGYASDIAFFSFNPPDSAFLNVKFNNTSASPKTTEQIPNPSFRLVVD